MIKGNGHTLPLDGRQRMSTTIQIYWQPGKLNHADYWTKHHSAAHHVNVRKEFLTPYIVIEMLQMKKDTMNQVTAPAA